MKLANLMKVALAVALTATALTAKATDGQGGNGGGGVIRDGRYMTFYSAGFYTEPTEATAEEVPQLQKLVDWFNSTQVMSEQTKVKWETLLIPTPQRNYYRVKSNTFTPEVRQRLIAEYSRVMSIDASHLALFAITDTQSRSTYLFPEFYSLKPIEQMAILFHETYWLANPKATYQQVVDAEMSFQAYLAAPNVPERMLKMLGVAGTNGDVLTAAIRTDLSNGSLKGLISGGHSIQLQKLLGPQVVPCILNRGGAMCPNFAVTYAYSLTRQYPKSLFIKLYYNHLSTGDYSMKLTGHHRWGNLGLFTDTSDKDYLRGLAGVGSAVLDFNTIGYKEIPTITGSMESGGYKGFELTLNN